MLKRIWWQRLCVIVGSIGLAGLMHADDGVEFVPNSTPPKAESKSTPVPRVRPPKPPKLSDKGVEYKGDTEQAPKKTTPGLPFVSTGETTPEFKPVDDLLKELVTEQKVPGVSVAIVKDGRLMYARGFGYADVEQKQPAQPDSFYRIASLSKPLTSTGIFKLVDQGRLDLDQPVFELLEIEPFLKDGEEVDARLKDVTVRHCLQHTGGWDRDSTYDPLFRPNWIAEKLGTEPPLNSIDLIRYQSGRPLDFDPGQKYHYSNFGYCVLGRVIEKISGQTYEQFMQNEVFEPLGMRDIRLGRELAEDRGEREVVYYTPNPWNAPCTVAPRVGEQLLCQYGAWSLTVMDSGGGWTTTAIELARFASTFYGDSHPLLSKESLEVMFAPPAPPVSHDRDGKPDRTYYACGWQVKQSQDGFNAWHTGLFKPGSSALMVRRRDGLVWVVLCNQDSTKKDDLPSSWIDSRMHRAVDEIREWPERDLFLSLNPVEETAPASP